MSEAVATKRICPVLYAGLLASGSGLAPEKGAICREDCAWYIRKRCAMTEIADELAQVAIRMPEE